MIYAGPYFRQSLITLYRRRRRARIARACARAALVAAALAGLLAPLLAGGADWSFSAAQVQQLEADLDEGGRTDLSTTRLAASVSGKVAPRLRIGVDLQLEQEDWRFGAPAAFDGVAPWNEVERAALGLQFHYVLRPQWLITIAPGLRFAGERDADDALGYGAALGAARVLAPDRRLGLGVSVRRDVERTRVLPYIAVAWRLDEHWQLANAPPTAPAGQSAFELSYAAGERWTFATGCGYRLERFRLNDDGPYGDAIAESRGVPIYARLAYTAPLGLRLESYAGALVGGEVRIEGIEGRSDIREDYDVAPIVGASLSLPL